MTQQDTPPPAGHNRPPAYDPAKVEALTLKVAEWADAGTDWLNTEKIEDAEGAAKLNDYISGARSVIKDIEETRKDEKAPHLAAGREVDEAYKAIGRRLEKTLQAINPLMTAWLKRVDEQKAAERRAREAEARAAAEEAERQRKQAEARNDMAGVADAEDAAKKAAKLEKNAAKVETAKAPSYSGGGRSISLRKKRVVSVENVRLAFLYFRENEAVMDQVAEVLKKAAAEEIRGGVDPDDIPGITTSVIEVAA